MATPARLSHPVTRQKQRDDPAQRPGGDNPPFIPVHRAANDRALPHLGHGDERHSGPEQRHKNIGESQGSLAIRHTEFAQGHIFFPIFRISG